jgi:hypothetical protein
MFVLNFMSPHNEKLLIDRQKNVTIRMGDIRETYPESSIVHITVGETFSPKKYLYTAIIDRINVKKFSELTTQDLSQQNPNIKTVEELMVFFEKTYQRTMHIDDVVSVIHFSELLDQQEVSPRLLS